METISYTLPPESPIPAPLPPGGRLPPLRLWRGLLPYRKMGRHTGRPLRCILEKFLIPHS